MARADGPEQRQAELDAEIDAAYERDALDELRADELRDALLDVMTPPAWLR